MAHEPEAVTIIGAGAVGSFLAYRLASEGVAVTLVEKDWPGAKASGTSAGNVQPNVKFRNDLQGALGAEALRLFRSYLPQIKAVSGIDPLDQEVQYLYAAFDDAEAAQIHTYINTLREAGLRAQWIEGNHAHQLEPRLSPKIVGAMLHQDCIQMDAQLFVSALVESAKAMGVQVLVGEAVGLRHYKSKINAVCLKDGNTISCDTVILAMGAWTGQSANQWLGIPLHTPLSNVQKLHLKVQGQALNYAVRWNGVNIIQRRDGLTHLGSKSDPTDSFEAHPTPEGREWLLEKMSTMMPGLEMEVAEAKAACATQGDKPILGPLSSIKGVYVAAPSYEGFLLSPVMADMLADLLLSNKQHPLLASMLPERTLSPNRDDP